MPHHTWKPSLEFHEYLTRNGSTAVIIRPKREGTSCYYKTPSYKKYCKSVPSTRAPPRDCPEYRWPGGPLELTCAQLSRRGCRHPYSNNRYHHNRDQSPGRSQFHQYHHDDHYLEDVPHFYQLKNKQRCKDLRCRKRYIFDTECDIHHPEEPLQQRWAGGPPLSCHLPHMTLGNPSSGLWCGHAYCPYIPQKYIMRNGRDICNIICPGDCHCRSPILRRRLNGFDLLSQW